MHVRWSVLNFGLLLSNELFGIFRCFIVQLVKLRTIASHSEVRIDVIVCLEKVGSVTRFDRVRLYVVAVDCIKDDDVAVASVGGDWKTSRLVAV